MLINSINFQSNKFVLKNLQWNTRKKFFPLFQITQMTSDKPEWPHIHFSNLTLHHTASNIQIKNVDSLPTIIHHYDLVSEKKMAAFICFFSLLKSSSSWTLPESFHLKHTHTALLHMPDPLICIYFPWHAPPSDMPWKLLIIVIVYCLSLPTRRPHWR